MKTWYLKDLRKYNEGHPLEGAKISAEDKAAFTYTLPELTLNLDNHTGHYNGMQRGDEAIIRNTSRTEIIFAGLIDQVEYEPKTYSLKVRVLNHGIKVKDNQAAGEPEIDEEGEETGNIVVEVNSVEIDEALEKCLYKSDGEQIFKADFADEEEFLNTPYSEFGASIPILYNEHDKNSWYKYLTMPSDEYKWGFYRRDSSGLNYFLIFYLTSDGSSAVYGYKAYTLTTEREVQLVEDRAEFDNKDFNPPGYTEVKEIQGHKSNTEMIKRMVANQDVYIGNNRPPYYVQYYKSNDNIYFLVDEVLEDEVEYGNAILRRHMLYVGMIDSILNTISYSYTNPTIYDILKELSILTNAIWWVDKNINDKLPTLHFYPREKVVSEYDLRPFRKYISTIKEKSIVREFDQEVSDNVEINDVIRANTRKYYQDKSGEYVQTEIEMFARWIGDNFGVSLYTDLFYGEYLIGQVDQIYYKDKDTTVMRCIREKSNRDKNWWE